MEDWVTIDKVYPFEAQARKAAQVIRVTESRLLSSERGARYDVETQLAKVSAGWQIRWRKVLIGDGSGCNGCGSCQSQSTLVKRELQSGKVLQFKFKHKEEKGD